MSSILNLGLAFGWIYGNLWGSDIVSELNSLNLKNSSLGDEEDIEFQAVLFITLLDCIAEKYDQAFILTHIGSLEARIRDIQRLIKILSTEVPNYLHQAQN